MTDRERFLELLADFGVKPLRADQGDLPGWGELKDQDVVLMQGEGGVDGYTMFFCRWEFNEDGSFKSVGVWE